MLTLPGAGRAGVVRELKNPARPDREGVRGQRKRSMQKSWRRSGTRCKWKVKSSMGMLTGMDDDEETPSGIRPNAESRKPAQAEEAIDLKKEWNELLEDIGKAKLTPG